jgi:hypothetical protein
VNWNTGARTARGSLVVDHLDGNKTNNHLENLVPSCHRCNCSRSRFNRIRDDELTVMGGAGRRIRAREALCAQCGRSFLVACDQDPRRGRFCSRACVAKHTWARRKEEGLGAAACGNE